MARVRLLRGGRVTLPAEMRQQLRVEEGDCFEALMVEDGVLLKPAAVVDREKALEQMLAAKARVQPTPEQARKSPEEQEREVFEEMRAMRREHAQSRPR